MIDNKTNYRSADLVAVYDAERRIGVDDYVNQQETDYFLGQATRILGSSAPARVIDFGAGTGKLSLAFARQGHQVVAFDQSPAMLEALRRKAAAEGLTVECRLGDIIETPPDGEFDLAVSSRVLMHVADPAAMIARMAGAARRGVILDAPRRFSPNSLLVAWRRRFGGEVYRCFDDAALTAEVARQGLEVLDATPMFTLPIGLHLALANRRLSRMLEAGLGFARPAASTLFIAAARRL